MSELSSGRRYALFRSNICLRRAPALSALVSFRGRYDGVGCASGGLVFGLDLDHVEKPLALAVREIADELVGSTPVVRIGQPHKSLRLYRQDNVISYNWKAPSGSERMLVPLGLMAGRTFVINDSGTAMDVNVGYYAVNRSPQGGPNRQFKFGLSFFF